MSVGRLGRTLIHRLVSVCDARPRGGPRSQDARASPVSMKGNVDMKRFWTAMFVLLLGSGGGACRRGSGAAANVDAVAPAELRLSAEQAKSVSALGYAGAQRQSAPASAEPAAPPAPPSSNGAFLLSSLKLI